MKSTKTVNVLPRLLLATALCVATGAASAEDLLSILSDEGRWSKKTDPSVRSQPVVIMPAGIGRVYEKPSVRPEKPVGVEKPVEKVVVVERTNVVEKTVDRIVEKPVERIVEVRVPVTNTVERIVVVERTNVIVRTEIVERTNYVEKVVLDKSRERELVERERQLLERQAEILAAKERTEASLAKERDRRQRLERVIPEEKRRFADNNMKISAPTTFYDKKEGYAVFEGGVHVRDNRYDLHSKRAFVFNDPLSNTVARVVAIGHVAVTNGSQRAYGAKASYHRKTGMVILYGDEETPAVVSDESRVNDQTVVGEKIKFWVNRQQVEVLKARISAPVDGGLAPGLPVK